MSLFDHLNGGDMCLYQNRYNLQSNGSKAAGCQIEHFFRLLLNLDVPYLLQNYKGVTGAAFVYKRAEICISYQTVDFSLHRSEILFQLNYYGRRTGST